MDWEKFAWDFFCLEDHNRKEKINCILDELDIVLFLSVSTILIHQLTITHYISKMQVDASSGILCLT